MRSRYRHHTWEKPWEAPLRGSWSPWAPTTASWKCQDSAPEIADPPKAGVWRTTCAWSLFAAWEGWRRIRSLQLSCWWCCWRSGRWHLTRRTRTRSSRGRDPLRRRWTRAKKALLHTRLSYPSWGLHKCCARCGIWPLLWWLPNCFRRYLDRRCWTDTRCYVPRETRNKNSFLLFIFILPKNTIFILA